MTESRYHVFSRTSFVLLRFQRALQQNRKGGNRTQSRVNYLLSINSLLDYGVWRVEHVWYSCTGFDQDLINGIKTSCLLPFFKNSVTLSSFYSAGTKWKSTYWTRMPGIVPELTWHYFKILGWQIIQSSHFFGFKFFKQFLDFFGATTFKRESLLCRDKISFCNIISSSYVSCQVMTNVCEVAVEDFCHFRYSANIHLSDFNIGNNFLYLLTRARLFN